MDFDRHTDTILAILKEKRTPNLGALIKSRIPEIDGHDNRDLLINYMRDKGLIEPPESAFNEYEYIITTTGVQIITQYGGWLGYLEFERTRQSNTEKKEEIKEKRTNRFSLFRTIIATFEILLLALSVYLADKTNRQQEQIEQLIRQKDSISVVTAAQSHLLEKMDKRLEMLILKIDSLRYKVKKRPVPSPI